MIAFCSIPPQSYLIERVGGDRASVHVLVGPGQSPHTFEPAPKQMAALAKADIYFTIGLPFDNPYRALLFLSGHDFFANGDGDVLDPDSLKPALAGVDVAYYLVHALAGVRSTSAGRPFPAPGRASAPPSAGPGR